MDKSSNKLKDFEITFYLTKGEVGTLEQAPSLDVMRDRVKNYLRTPIIEVAEDLLVCSQHVTQVLIQERNDIDEDDE